MYVIPIVKTYNPITKGFIPKEGQEVPSIPYFLRRIKKGSLKEVKK